MKKINKSFDEMTVAEKIAVKNGFAKAIDTPANFRIGGVLQPDEIDSLISYVQDQSKILKMITVLNLSGTTANLNDYSTSEDGTHAPSAFGTYPSDTTTNVSNPGNKITLYPLQETYVLKDVVLQDNLKRSGFENSVMNALQMQWSNSLAKLSMVGTAYTAGSFGAMLKGFPQLLTDAAATVTEVTYANYADMIALLDGMDQAMPEKYAGISDLTYFVKKSDHDKLWSLLQSGNASGLAYLKDSNGITFKGKPVEWMNGMPASKAILTSPKNLVLAFNQDGMKLETERQASAAADGIFLNYQATFGVFNYEAVVYAT